MRSFSPATLRWAALIAAVLFLTGLFWLPYRVAVAPTVSASYFFGYNNRVAELVVAAGMVLLALFGPALPLVQSGLARPLGRSTLYKTLAGTFVISAALFLLTRKLDGFEESVYLIDRVKQK